MRSIDRSPQPFRQVRRAGQKIRHRRRHPAVGGGHGLSAPPQPIIDACKAKAEEGIWGYTSRPASYFEAVQEWEVKAQRLEARYRSYELEPGRGCPPCRHRQAVQQRRGQGPDPDAGLFRVPTTWWKHGTAPWWKTSWWRKTAIGTLISTTLPPRPKSAASSCCATPTTPWASSGTPADLRRMAEICIENGTLLVSDEIHSD